MRTLLLFFFLCGLTLHLQAQGLEQKSLEVGSYLKINSCKKEQKEFESMDVYARTKPYNKSKIDTLTGDGLLEEFFNDKSIDAKRLPCSMGDRKYKIASLQEFTKEGKTNRVVLCYTTYPLTLIWIELDKAIEKGEISID